MTKRETPLNICISFCLKSNGRNAIGTVTRNFFFKPLFVLFVPRFSRVRSPSRVFYFMYYIWQYAGIRTRVAATAARCAINELHTFLMSCTHLYELHLSLWAQHIPNELHTSLMSYTHPHELHASLMSYTHPYELSTSLMSYTHP